MTKTVVVLLMSSTVLLASCGRTGLPVSPSQIPSLSVQNLVSAVAAGNTQGASKPGQAPSSAGGPVATVTANQTVINGGTMLVTITASAPFDAIYMYAGAKTVGLASESAGGIDGYYEVHLPSRQMSAPALLSFAQTLPLSQFQLLFAVADSSGPVGPFTALDTTAIAVGTGDIQVTLSWDVDSDVDLHVIDPSGEEIYYGHPQSASGGTLDLDSNAGCALDHKRNENITWPVGRAPRGTYTVRVDYWSNCLVTQTTYTVRINNGGAAQILNGSFTGPGDEGGRGSGRLVATFERLNGPAPQQNGSAPGANDVGPSLKTKAPWAQVKE
jgi:uncharacterized protein YfaP (DUF2135 family)